MTLRYGTRTPGNSSRTPFCTSPLPGPKPPPDWSMVRAELLEALLADKDMLILSLSRVITSRDNLIPFYREAAQPAMYEVGRLWEQGVITIAQEHRATARLGRLISTLHAAYIHSDGGQGRAVVAAVSEEYHELGAWIVSDALELNNWEIRYLGGNPPLEIIIELARRFRPDLLALSITLPENLAQARAIITALRDNLPENRIPVLVGGQALNRNPDLWRELGADAYACDLGEAVITAGRLRDEQRPGRKGGR